MKLIDQTTEYTKYLSHDYEITVSGGDIQVKPLYNLFAIYFDIRFNKQDKEFFAIYDLGMSLKIENKDMWILGVNNTTELLEELNNSIDLLDI